MKTVLKPRGLVYWLECLLFIERREKRRGRLIPNGRLMSDLFLQDNRQENSHTRQNILSEDNVAAGLWLLIVVFLNFRLTKPAKLFMCTRKSIRAEITRRF